MEPLKVFPNVNGILGPWRVLPIKLATPSPNDKAKTAMVAILYSKKVNAVNIPAHKVIGPKTIFPLSRVREASSVTFDISGMLILF